MNDNKTKGMTISFSNQVPETFDQAGYEALDYTDINGVEVVGTGVVEEESLTIDSQLQKTLDQASDTVNKIAYDYMKGYLKGDL
jgi:hypothetical protein